MGYIGLACRRPLLTTSSSDSNVRPTAHRILIEHGIEDSYKLNTVAAEELCQREDAHLGGFRCETWPFDSVDD